MKINQYCSVCKKHLDMEVVPTDDGGDDGVIWLQCPECRGFLPKFTGEATAAKSDESARPTAESAEAAPEPASADRGEPDASAELAAPDASGVDLPDQETVESGAESTPEKEPPRAEPEEPVAEYQAQLAAADPAGARPYRPTETYDVGDVLHHLAWDDIGVVVAREVLPGGRRVVKAFFETVGVVRLIEQATDGS